MAKIPESVAAFLRGKRIVIAGVSRQPRATANFIFRKLRELGYDTLAVNPHATEVEGVACYPDVGSVPGAVDGVLVATHPAASLAVVRQSLDRGIGQIWFHRSFGDGSVAEDAVRECRARGVECIVGGCPLMYCAPVDFGHRCMRWWLRRGGRVPG
jgi:predicted CoA-binding protein